MLNDNKQVNIPPLQFPDRFFSSFCLSGFLFVRMVSYLPLLGCVRKRLLPSSAYNRIYQDTYKQQHNDVVGKAHLDPFVRCTFSLSIKAARK